MEKQLTFKVTLLNIDDEKRHDKTILSDVDINEIVDWYQNQAEFYEKFYEVQNIIYKYDYNNKQFIVCYKYDQDKFCEDDKLVLEVSLLDPDDDGNNPIKLGDEEYLVYGELMQ
jgi:hypothetical protein